ncbi:MAG: type II secretion system protein [Planctomycetes bacterium]|nr:type II secretion system protein [Planctomycetota bacterium]MBI3847961.1 type II secretion system protein [Planctomycetota bacterium]
MNVSSPISARTAERGFTLIELVVIIVILGVLSAVAVPIFVDLQDEANQAAEEGVVGNVRSAISLYYANLAASGTPRYPGSLDAATASSSAGNTNPFFTSVLSQGGVTRDWTKNASSQYVGPAGGVYAYTSATGQFTKQ